MRLLTPAAALLSAVAIATASTGLVVQRSSDGAPSAAGRFGALTDGSPTSTPQGAEATSTPAPTTTDIDSGSGSPATKGPSSTTSPSIPSTAPADSNVVPSPAAREPVDEPAVIGDAGLFIVDPDTKAARRVVEGSLMDAVWLGDKQIAFIRNAAIWVVNADGSGERKLQQGIVDGGMRSLHLSPDRRWIAYVSESGGSGDRSVYVMRSDGSGRRQVFADTLNETMGWSPDSKRLAFVGFDGQSPGMYVYDLAEDRSTLLYGAFLDQPTWTPDGSEIVFFDGSIMAIDVATGQYRQLAHPPEFAPTPIILSRDGREVYYARYDDASEATWWSIALDGGTPQKIGSGTHAFLWSRSDDRAAIVERTGEQDFDYRWITRLVVAAPDLSDRTTVAIAGTYTTIYGQRWSPHGKRLLVRANQLRTPHKRP